MDRLQKQDIRTLDALLDEDMTVDALARRFDVSRMTAARYLLRLERMGIVTQRVCRQKRGRPVRVFSLTPSWRYWILQLNEASCNSASVRPSGRTARAHTQPYAHGMEPWENLADCLGRMRMISPLFRGKEETKAVAVILRAHGEDCPLPKGEVDMIRRADGVSLSDICKELNRKILE